MKALENRHPASLSCYTHALNAEAVDYRHLAPVENKLNAINASLINGAVVWSPAHIVRMTKVNQLANV
mgnify:CR=1 FL=1